MKVRKFTLLAISAVALLLAACNTSTDNGGGPSALATVDEAVTSTNGLVSDVVSVFSGFASNSTLSQIGTSTCEADFDFELEFTAFPGVLAMFYDLDETWMPTNWRLATGTISCDPATGVSTYEAEPTDALVVQWPSEETGEQVEARITWSNLSKATTYDHDMNLGVGPYLWPQAEEIDVPGTVGLTLDYSGQKLVDVSIQQTMAETQCGPLFEYRTLHATGNVTLGGQGAVLENLRLNHTVDNEISLELAGSVTSGSLQIPFAASANVEAGAAIRSELNCQLSGVEGPVSGSVDLQIGSQAAGLGLAFDFRAEFEDGDLDQLTVTDARLRVGQKYVEVDRLVTDADGMIGIDYTQAVLTFGNRTDVPIQEVFEMLTIPEWPN